MSSNQNNNFLRKEIQISAEQIPKEENLSQQSLNNYINKENLQEEIYQQENDIENEDNNDIILKKENEEEINSNNNYNYNYDYSNEIYIINKKDKVINNKRSQQKVYTKIKTESSRNPKAKISTYIYKAGKVFPKKNNITSNLNKYINTAKYSIKNPIKEKSKNKYKKKEINETDINNINYNNNIDDYGYNNINQTNYIYERNNVIEEMNINNNDINDNEINNINIITKSKNIKNKRIISQQVKKPEYISFNSFNKLQDVKYNYVPNTTKGEGRITYICDFSQENNKDSYYVESPSRYKRHITVYPIDGKMKIRKNKANKIKKHKSSDKLKKEVEDSKKKFEKIREIEREIKNYFNLNGLDILNRELYDQSATMIQATFRAYFSRKKLYEELNLYINIKNAIDILKDIFKTRKINYWENFINSLLEYITILNSNMNINENIIETGVNLNSEKYQDLNDEFNNIENNNKIKYVKKIPNSYKQKAKNKIINNNFLIPQPCISFYFDNLSNTEEAEKSNKKGRNSQKSNLSLNDNIIKDTQESVELRLNDKVFTPNKNDIKLDKLKYVFKLIELKYKEILYKSFIKLCNYATLLKYSSNINNSILNNEKNKTLKRIVINQDKNLKNIKKNFFIKFYYKGLINSIKNENQNDINNNVPNNKENENENEKENAKEEENIKETANIVNNKTNSDK